MNTIVETFFVEETASLIYDNDDLQKWGDLVTQLGLTGQQKVVTGEKSPIPFLWMNESLINLFKCLCPRQVDIKDYDKMPIPLEILGLVSLSEREEYFFKIEIWYDENTPDPVCVGYRLNASPERQTGWMRESYAEKYLLGKWSDVKASFAELLDRAKKRFISERGLLLRQQIKEAQRGLEDLEDTAQRQFGVGSTINLPF
ncbi:hypothetical protein AB6805_30515 [Chitinophaga sp. RCC_12]|uniref:hypothetical protein n=1 Tax=Chitinophaga sp. RCC_12 TaxID=3239226 RepID=UPI00352439F8